MARIDVARLRKEHGMSQIQLASKLQITQSFLSAIENGRSPLPPEKESKIMEIFSLPSLHAYTISEPLTNEDIPPRSNTEIAEEGLIGQLLNRMHKEAHRGDENHHESHHERIAQLEQSNDRLLQSNDSLLKRIDSMMDENKQLRDDNYSLKEEILHLKEEIIHLKGLIDKQ